MCTCERATTKAVPSIGLPSVAALYAVQDAAPRYDVLERPDEAAAGALALLVAWGFVGEVNAWARCSVHDALDATRAALADGDAAFRLYEALPFCTPHADTASNDDDDDADESRVVEHARELARGTLVGRAVEHARNTARTWAGAADAIDVAVRVCADIGATRTLSTSGSRAVRDAVRDAARALIDASDTHALDVRVGACYVARHTTSHYDCSTRRIATQSSSSSRARRTLEAH